MNNNFDKYKEFREKYPEFIYKDYKYEINNSKLEIEYSFEIKDLCEFKPKWSIAIINNEVDIDDKKLSRLIFSLGMVEVVSYLKATCSKTLNVEANYLTEKEANWWKKLYVKGLGEFFYLNQITIDDNFLNIISNTDKKEVITDVESNNLSNHQVLVPIGGGKDSAVSLELLKDKLDRYCYVINPRGATTDTINVAGLEENAIFANRVLDRKLIELNDQGFLNGHTPYSAIVAFSSVIAAYINGIKYCALSNESSANESTVENTDVNHQYSKSFEFEKDFVDYELENINSGVNYFSILRPLAELQIAKLFAGYKQYHSIFRSCNSGSKDNIWCASCPKCLFVYIILAPFLSKEEMINIFGRDMLDDEEMKDNLEKLVGVQTEKPFECVGSRDEVNLALQMTNRKYISEKETIPVLLSYYNSLNIELIDEDSILKSFDEVNLIPDELKDVYSKSKSNGYTK